MTHQALENLNIDSFDRMPSPAEENAEGATPVVHENIRGGDYYK